MSMSESESDEETVAGIDFDFSNANSASRIARAVREINFGKVKELIDQGASVDIPDNRGFTALHEAAQNDRCYKIARLLIKSGSFVDHVTHNGDTPLHFAVFRSCRRIVKLLLSHKCLVNKHNLEGLTPLHYACIKNDLTIVKLLLKAGADINAKTYVDETPIYKAVQESNIKAVELLIQSGADLSINDYYNRSLLQISCASDPKIFDILFPLFPPSAVDHSSDDGWTILMESLQLRNFDIAAKLIQNGADTTKTDFRDLLPLHIAAHSGSYECFELILQKTPASAIEQYAVVSGTMVHSRSIACLLLDKHMYEGLRLFLSSNLHKNVIACPTMMGERLVSPVCFLLLHTCIEDKVKYLELLLTKDELVFPLYEGFSFPTTLEALSTTHILPHNCQCVEMLHLLLEKGANPDLTSNGKFLPDFFYRLLITNFVQGVLLSLQYTKFIEPRHLLNVYCEELPQEVSNRILEAELDGFEFRMRMMEPLLSITNDINTPLSLLKLASKTSVGKKVYEYALKNYKVPSLKTLSRSSIREHLHQYCQQNEFLTALRSLPLPKPMIDYLTYKILC